ncbi:hypothetical protein [Streptomyces huiliensis]|uniref:hypothetical protein n=1 Tax=Streptomyces huiliensis TaxID=2876027 RepID=UPI001CC04B2E|nr:hypothetical protein [Streptomyces huiliensis]MBZ4319707.1 hypothetical protein [Streptomyces huiliensis]
MAEACAALRLGVGDLEGRRFGVAVGVGFLVTDGLGETVALGLGDGATDTDGP